MNRAELIDKVAEVAGVTKKDTDKVLSALFGNNHGAGIIVDTVAAGEAVQIIGFGTFGSSVRSARAGRNPQTGEEIQIAAKTLAKFKAGTRFTNALNN